MSSDIYPSESKKRVQFGEDINHQQLHQKQSKTIDSHNDKDFVRIIPSPQVVRLNFSEDIESILQNIDNRQNKRLESFATIISTYQHKNDQFIDTLLSLKQHLKLQQQEQQQSQQQSVVGSHLNNSKENKLSSFTHITNQNIFPNNNNSSNSTTYPQQYNEDSMPANSINNNRLSIIKQRKSQSSNSIINSKNQLIEERYSLQVTENYLKSILSQAVNAWGQGISISFKSMKVENYEEIMVDGYYFYLDSSKSKRHEFYIYEIPHLQEIEYNPVIISGYKVQDNIEDSENSENCFNDILSFSTSQLLGFFQSFFQFINNQQQ